MSTGMAVVLFGAVLFTLAAVNPKAAGILAAIIGLLLFSQLGKVQTI